MKLRNRQTFSSTKKSLKVKLQKTVVTLPEERNLMTRFVLASGSRPEIDLPKYLGKHEFSVVPRSNFSSAGQLNLGSDNSSIMRKIEDLIEKSTTGEKIDTVIEKPKSVVLFDGMAVVNRIKLGTAIKHCRDFATPFLHIIVAEGKEADEIRIAFDRYVRDSLKLSTRQKRNTSTPVRYEVADSTSLVNSTVKKLLSDVLTKQNLTIYLGML